MANAALSMSAEPVSDENDDIVSVRSELSNSTSSKSKKRTPRASQADFENLRRNVSEIDKRFSKVDSKLDRLMNMLPLLDTASLARQRPQSTCRDTTVAHTVTGTTGADTVGYELHDDDTLSIQPGQQERTQLLGDDESLHSNSPSHANSLIGDHGVNNDDSDTDDRFMKYSRTTHDLLRDMFGQDATTKPDKGVAGIVLDKAQRDVLSETWRADKPAKISSFKESYRTVFPVAEEAEEFLRVPSLDAIVSSLLMKRYGSKASVKSQQLYSQPLRDLEKLAFQGQHAARMGIVINLYMQQALGNLLRVLSDKDANIDSAIQCVRDIFAMNTKSLDQLGRTGAIHHLVRRKAAMADCGLNDSREVRNQIWNLPLSHDGICGSGLEQKLKERVEMNKQISDLLPEVERKPKRKAHSAGDQHWKRPRYADDRQQSYRPYQQSYHTGTSRPQYRPTATATFPRFPKSSTPKSSAVSGTFRGKSKQ